MLRKLPKQDNSAEQDDFSTPEISARNLKTSEKILPEENSSLSADLEDYIKTLTRDFNDKTAYWSTPYENEAKVEKEEVNEVKGFPGSSQMMIYILMRKSIMIHPIQ
ncbi:6730_t:CDS:2 [Funneliformis mosseae]|uniref:6730_t:CDS:1 n=1 Tax=Funneliformis mosseae TaxID=27381 RepID=A0A9N8YYC0_FUNMO|nr:6730_t:CDS:2 [Funneliformis mosseae]